jgi:HK97 gp10 family phage protein
MPTANETTVLGLREAKAAFQKMPAAFRDALNDATEVTVREIARNAKARIIASPSIRTRALLNHITWSMNARTGRGRAGVASGTTTLTVNGRKVRVRGIIIAGKGGSARTSQGAKKINPSRYAHFVEFGTVRMPAEPFMLPATEGQKGPYLQRCQAAGRTAERTLANVGSRFL